MMSKIALSIDECYFWCYNIIGENQKGGISYEWTKSI